MKLWIGIVMVLFIAGGTAYGVNAMEYEETRYEEREEKVTKVKSLVQKQLNKLQLKR